MKTMMLSLSCEIDDFLTAVACERGITKAEAMQGAVALLKIAYDQKHRGDGSSLGLVRRMPDNSLEAVGVVTGV
ncbi:hypothetical protein GTP44_05265 [Duganella sp. FT50W]|uniref:Ribbon-helix-helix protein, CopG family n=1 Tax=Duganella lactea TaxID=2692173 RepID=A0A6L8MHX6_9BURK|nr:hypothetical protein [Duganella lactea]MYM34130.1 hypothetical protein [Duganella lactea]MYM81366.1 hypothetical protein [Duganella lactea]